MTKTLMKTHIPGFDDSVLRGGIPRGHVVLVRGAAGTMKTSFVYYILYQNALKGVPGLYVTFEQGGPSLLEHVAALGLQSTLVSDSLPILDLSRGRDYLEEVVRGMTRERADHSDFEANLLAALKGKIADLRRRTNLELLALDSWDAMELLVAFEDRRSETFLIFEWLRDLGVTSLVISEEPPAGAREYALEEEFLADGVVLLKTVHVGELSFQRRVRCIKMRSVNHDTDAHALLYENGRFEVAPAIG